MKSILVVLAPENFRDIEYIVPRAFFEQAGHTVMTTSTQKKSIGKHGYRVENDLLLTHAQEKDFEGIFFVGGLGSLIYKENQTAHDLVNNFIRKEKTIGAICAAPRSFLQWGILKGKWCTGHDWDGNFAHLCESSGALYDPKDVVVDGKIVTANGPEAAESCALQFLKVLSS